MKAEENLKAKSLKVYAEQFQPEQAIKLSMADYRERDWASKCAVVWGFYFWEMTFQTAY